MLLAIPAVLIVVIAAVMMMFGGSDAGYFRNSEWGMSVSEVEKAEGRDIYLEGTSAILFIVDDFDCVEGNDVSVMYSFTSGKLTSAFVSIDYSGVSVYSVLYDLYDLYCDRYGDPTVDGGYVYVWETEASEITIGVIDGSMMVLFSDITTVD